MLPSQTADDSERLTSFTALDRYCRRKHRLDSGSKFVGKDFNIRGRVGSLHGST